MVENVVVVVVDALRADRVGALDDRSDLTPRIDELAEDGAVFHNAFTTTNVTDAAVTSLHTGRHPQSNGLIHHAQYVTDEEKRAVGQVTPLPEVLQRSGMRTIKTGRAMGRWHTRGFDEVPTVAEDANSSGSVLSTNKRLKSAVKSAAYGASDRLGYTVSAIHRRLTDNSTSTAIDSMLGKLDGSSPFYGFVHLMDTHIPYEPREELIRRYEPRYERGETLRSLAERYPTGSVSRKEIEIKIREHGGLMGQGAVDTAHIAARYDGTVREADEKVGRLVDGLESKGLRDETALVVLSDHGESLTEHDIPYDHHGLYEPTVRIPLVVSVPDAPRREVDEFVQLTDVAPTVLDLCGVSGDVDLDLDLDGRSLLPLIEGGGEWESRDVVVAEEAHTQRKRMVRSRDHKCIWAVDEENTCRYCEFEHAAPEAMFDLRTDPGETENVVDDEPAEFRRLRERSREIRRGFEAKRPDGRYGEEPTFEDEESVLDRLEQLGYR